MERYNVTGMSCAACSGRVEKAVLSVDGVQTCSVNLLTNSMTVDGTASHDAIVAAVSEAGYGASLKSETASAPSNKKETLRDTKTPLMKKRLFLLFFHDFFLIFV